MEIPRLRCFEKVFYVTIADADIESLVHSIHSLMSILYFVPHDGVWTKIV